MSHMTILHPLPKYGKPHCPADFIPKIQRQRNGLFPHPVGVLFAAMPRAKSPRDEGRGQRLFLKWQRRSEFPFGHSSLAIRPDPFQGRRAANALPAVLSVPSKIGLRDSKSAAPWRHSWRLLSLRCRKSFLRNRLYPLGTGTATGGTGECPALAFAII